MDGLELHEAERAYATAQNLPPGASDWEIAMAYESDYDEEPTRLVLKAIREILKGASS